MLLQKCFFAIFISSPHSFRAWHLERIYFYENLDREIQDAFANMCDDIAPSSRRLWETNS